MSAHLEPAAAARPRFDVERIRADFPALHQEVHGKPLVYLDSAATTQKPTVVVEAVTRYYREYCANVHRAVHFLSERATDAFDAAREKVRRYLNARDAAEIVFVRGTTEAINLVAYSWGRRNLRAGDEILITGLEHHSNIVPWQILGKEVGATLVVAPINDAGEVELDALERRLSPRTRLVSVAHISNALGTIVPVRRIVELAHARGVPVLVDGAQAAAHVPIDVQALGCDFYAFSGHKVCGPTGIGVLYGRSELLETMPPFHGGGEMIRRVTFEETTFADPPARFEAGTPDIAGAIGLGAALDYVAGIGLDRIAARDAELLAYATRSIAAIPGVRIIGTAAQKSGVLSFVLEGVHPHDLGTILDREGIAIRTGHHCAQPVMDRFGVPATSRAAFAFYNTESEIDALVGAIYRAKEFFRV